jgi:methyltransferase (TIGR00027 family)
MADSNRVIENISDTALWVAFYRAMETDRPDAHFRDPFARILAGERGEEIVKKMPGAQRSAWAMIVRTCVFDEVILGLIRQNAVDVVLNLAAGLDTRPYRLSLPETLSWFEIDFPPILNYKEEKLKDEKPVCRLERIKMDLSDVTARRKAFSRISNAGKQVLIITEGLLVYLSRDQVAALANDLHAQPNFRWWLLDYITPRLLKMLLRSWDKTLSAANSRMQFAPEEGLDFYRNLGWKVAEFHETWEDARRLKRRMKFSALFDVLSKLRSKKVQEEYRNMAGNLLLEKS